MSFGLGISFGRLSRRERTLEDVYLGARKIDKWKTFRESFGVGWAFYEYVSKRTADNLLLTQIHS
jgi:hypothetical protein